jgi:hypothetical protein
MNFYSGQERIASVGMWGDDVIKEHGLRRESFEIADGE